MRRVNVYEIPKEDVRNVTVDFSVTASNFGVSVSSVTWQIDEGSTVSLSGSPSLSSNVTTETVTANTYTGCNLIRVVATMADSQKVSKYFKLNVIDPAC